MIAALSLSFAAPAFLAPVRVFLAPEPDNSPEDGFELDRWHDDGAPPLSEDSE
jgi:hypothetical protein